MHLQVKMGARKMMEGSRKNKKFPCQPGPTGGQLPFGWDLPGKALSLHIVACEAMQG
jgi:hypothetical protein